MSGTIQVSVFDEPATRRCLSHLPPSRNFLPDGSPDPNPTRVRTFILTREPSHMRNSGRAER